MPAISFTGVTRAGAFYDMIRRGTKTQTIREPRKHPVKAGQRLHLYWKQRVAPKDKLGEPHYLGTVTVKEVKSVLLRDIWRDAGNAVADGFISLTEFREWFKGYPLAAELEIIRWDYSTMTYLEKQVKHVDPKAT